MHNVFDGIATVYDLLASVALGSKWSVIGRFEKQLKSEVRKVLIVGGGSGKMLEALPADLQVDYLDLSHKMIALAKKRSTQANVNFLTDGFMQWKSDARYDVVYFPFFLDCFSQGSVEQILDKVITLLDRNGELHVLDFQRGNGFQNMLIKCMYWFFRLVANVEGRQLPEINQLILSQNFHLKSAKIYRGKWVFYRVYALSEHKRR